VLKVATDIVDVISVSCYCVSTGVVPPHSPKLGVSYIKTKAHGAVSNLVTRSHARIRVETEGVGEGVCVSQQRS
jgi:hypothetical protein